jgi:hypothetical protein
MLFVLLSNCKTITIFQLARWIYLILIFKHTHLIAGNSGALENFNVKLGSWAIRLKQFKRGLENDIS